MANYRTVEYYDKHLTIAENRLRRVKDLFLKVEAEYESAYAKMVSDLVEENQGNAPLKLYEFRAKKARAEEGNPLHEIFTMYLRVDRLYRKAETWHKRLTRLYFDSKGGGR